MHDSLEKAAEQDARHLLTQIKERDAPNGRPSAGVFNTATAMAMITHAEAIVEVLQPLVIARRRRVMIPVQYSEDLHA